MYQQHDHPPENPASSPNTPQTEACAVSYTGGGGAVPGRLPWGERATDTVSAELFQGKFKLGLGFLQKPDLFSLGNQKAAIEDTSLAGPRGCAMAARRPQVLGRMRGEGPAASFSECVLGGGLLVKGLSPDPFIPKFSFSLPIHVGEGQHSWVRAVPTGKGLAHKAGRLGALSPSSQEPLPWLSACTEPKTLKGRHQGLCDVPACGMCVGPRVPSLVLPWGWEGRAGKLSLNSQKELVPYVQLLGPFLGFQWTHWKRP